MTDISTTPFLYTSCQHGAESLLKSSLGEPEGSFRIAYSAHGLLTFKSPMALPIWTRGLPEHPMIRSRGMVLQRHEGGDSRQLLHEIVEKYRSLDWHAMQVWQRDPAPVGWRGFEPGESVLAAEVARHLRSQLRSMGDSRSVEAHGLEPEPKNSSDASQPQENSVPQEISQLLEVIIDRPDRWWVAARAIKSRYDRWPAGIPHLPEEADPISRAYFKIAEAIAWSGIQIRVGEPIVEIGSSPGGACQWLLQAGAKVTGIDPAEMDPRILAHPHFTHWRKRSLQVKRKWFRAFRILVCDANVTPNYTLDTVEAIVTYPTSRFRALILTMKLPEWELAKAIPEHLDRVRSWGYESVEARQLSTNRREYCLVARRRIRKPSAPESMKS